MKINRNFINVGKIIYLGLIFKFFKMLGVKENYIFFSSFYGRQYSGDPKALHQELKRRKLDYQCIWLLNDKSLNVYDDIIVRRYSLKHLYYLARAKYRIDNCQESYLLKPHKDTVYIQTWHGTPLKKIAQDIDDNSFDEIKKDWLLDSQSWNYLTSPNRNVSNIFYKSFGLDEKTDILEFGNPRNDIFFSEDKEQKITKIKDSLGIAKNKKVILYAPTFRDGFESKASLNFSLEDMSNALGDNYVFLIRTHSNVVNKIPNIENNTTFKDVSRYSDAQELLLISDILISDYSSIFIDYSLLSRKIIFYAYDYEFYKSKCRDLYFDFETFVPGPIVQNSADLIKEILSGSFDKEKVKRFSDDYNTNTATASYDVLKHVGIIK
ncbi:CDP-glycerol glycerophosphotransferase family protein [Photobacterium aquimaris]|uniref:CDP-glycerol:poly(Glycerophosphate) glycerophosphotransferase n=1 Tax=Photobacterium aquimaris TaxID=512643 RepID=A0A1Y6KY74_9GAMM|nr:CDP-glycerol glycerophosphotransferase family protein [Photobacterium aquimaris]SMY17024.1 CDP-glycerol:poly(glycerophosphate) glycerophosphotransferase [Photobacterium aquimaris]